MDIFQVLRVAELLKQEKKSQRWLARESGINLSTINMICRGTKTNLNKIQEEKIAATLGVNPEELYYQGG